jgi:hypothetical protein
MTGAMRVRRLLLLMFFVYVVVDLGCAFVPGAFAFEAEDSVEAVSAYRIRTPAMPRLVSVPATATLAPLPPRTEPYVGDVQTVPSPVGWQPHAASARTAAPDPRPSAEDD